MHFILKYVCSIYLITLIGTVYNIVCIILYAIVLDVLVVWSTEYNVSTEQFISSDTYDFQFYD